MIDIKNKRLPCRYEMIRIDKKMSLDEFCHTFHVSSDRVIYSSSRLFNGDTVLILYPDCTRHIVLPLQTIEQIASMHNVTKEYILTKNNCQTIFIGQLLYI